MWIETVPQTVWLCAFEKREGNFCVCTIELGARRAFEALLQLKPPCRQARRTSMAPCDWGQRRGGNTRPLLVCCVVLAALRAVSASSPAAVPITYPSYPQVLQRLRALASAAPQLVELWNAQERFGVPSPGSCGEEECKHWFVTLSNRTSTTAQSLPSAAAGSSLSWLIDTPISRRPHVFLSGNLHGDEVVGPVTILHLLEDLVAARLRGDNPWLNHLVDSRVLVAIPVTNPLGFASRVRAENDMDPNRDFPFMTGGANCMRTTVARAVNEAFRAHLFPLAITFHGGMQSITYEWGAPNHYDSGSKSPDDSSQRAVGLVMAEAAGAFQGSRYPVGRTNAIVYPVTGGMEDWAYAGSWEPDAAARTPCSPTTYGGYPPDRTTYGPSELRALNMLVETADLKRPLESSLGMHGSPADAATWALPSDSSSGGSGGAVDLSASLGTLAGVLAVEGPGDGHVPRNMRLILSALDMALPYLKSTRWRLTSASPATSGAMRLLGESAKAQSPVAAASASLGEQAIWVAARAAGSADSGGDAPVTVGGPCTEVSASGGMIGMTDRLCSRHAAEYAPGDWMVTQLPVTTNDPDATGTGAAAPSPTSADAGATLSVGWDVGGGFWVHETALAVAAWDVRVPPSFLLSSAIGDMAAYPPDLSAGSVPAADVASLQQLHGLGAGEATAFAFHVRLLQLVLAGKLPMEQLPSQAAIWRSAAQSGSTRWLYGAIANAAPAGQSVGEAKPAPLPVELPSAAVRGVWSPEEGRAQGSIANPLSRVSGAPDLARHPFVTRFSQCVRLPTPLQPVDVAMLPASGCTPAGRQAAASEAANGVLRGASGSGTGSSSTNGGSASADEASAEASAGARSAATSTHRITRAFVVFPYAVVDKDWATVEQPASPAGTLPQGHLANARTNPAWRNSNAGVTVEGRALFAEAPRFLALTAVVPVAVPDPSPEPQSASGGSPSPAAAALSPSPSGGNVAPSRCPEVRLPTGSDAAVSGAVAAASVVSIGGFEVSASSLVAYAAVMTGALAFVLVVAAVRFVRQRRRARIAASTSRLTGSGAAAAVAGRSSRASRYEDRARLTPYRDVPSGEAGNGNHAHADGLSDAGDSELEMEIDDSRIDVEAPPAAAVSAAASVAPTNTRVSGGRSAARPAAGASARAPPSRAAAAAAAAGLVPQAVSASVFDDSDESDGEALAAAAAAAAIASKPVASEARTATASVGRSGSAVPPQARSVGMPGAAGRLGGATSKAATSTAPAPLPLDDAVERAVRALEEAGSDSDDAL